MSRPVRPAGPSRDQRLNRSRVVEFAVTLFLVGLMLALFRQPDLLGRPPLLMFGVFVLLSASGLVLGVWQYRLLDEFRRSRMVTAWAVSGCVSLFLLTALIVRAFLQTLDTTPAGQALPPPTFTLSDLYVPWVGGMVAQLVTHAVLYFHDQRG